MFKDLSVFFVFADDEEGMGGGESKDCDGGGVETFRWGERGGAKEGGSDVWWWGGGTGGVLFCEGGGTGEIVD
jgi:hypothetical protein